MAPPKLQKNVPRLPPDILLLVFEQLDGSTITILRLASKQLNALATPIKYQDLSLTEQIVSYFDPTLNPPEEVIRQVGQDVGRYSQHISITRSVSQSHAIRLLYGLDNLRSIRWCCSKQRYTESYFHGSYHPLHHTIFYCKEFRSRWPDLKLHIENLSFLSMSLPPDWSCDRSPEDLTNILSYKMTDWMPASALEVAQIKNSIMRQPYLDSLHLTCSSNGPPAAVSWDAKRWEKLPPVKELVLLGCDWTFDKESASLFWDWSKLTSLELYRVPIVPFLKSVPFWHLERLKTFKTDGYCTKSEQKEATERLYDVLLRIEALESLSAFCSLKAKDFTVPILKHSSSLQVLDLRDYSRQEATMCPFLPLQDLDKMSSGCENLMELVIDMLPNLIKDEPLFSFKQLARFRNLRRLSIVTSIPSYVRAVSLERLDWITAGAECFLRELNKVKHGALVDEVNVVVNYTAFEDGFRVRKDWWTKLTREAGIERRCKKLRLWSDLQVCN